jgi:hypothetical protein
MRKAAFLTALLLLAISAHATPANKAALDRHFDRFLPKNLNACTTCHLPSDKKDPQSLDEFPHNPFGVRLKAEKKELAAAGKPTDIPARISAIASEDSDGDGVDNLTEILLGHGPGDPNDKPTAAELTNAPAKLAEFSKFLSSYRWRPFEPVIRPPAPSVQDRAWVRNPIDNFIAAEHEQRSLHPRPEAPKPILLRRVYLDLIGLVPTPAELAAFENDPSPDAYEKVVDRLLSDPRYGERWGRHWMDIWRYSDWAGWTGGNQIRDSQPHIWRWRDWIVESLNKDAPYDQMLTDMLAADELYPEDADKLRATGFLVRNYKMLSREQWLEDTINHTSRAFMGLTMHCAKCHNHMFDPVMQSEYYEMRAIFEPHQVRIDRVPGELDTLKNGLARAYDADVKPTLFFIRGDERHPDNDRKIEPGVPKFLGGSLQIEKKQLPRYAAHPDFRPFVMSDTVAASEKALEIPRREYEAVRNDPTATAAQLSDAQFNLWALENRYQATVAIIECEKLREAAVAAGKSEKDESYKNDARWIKHAHAAVEHQRLAAFYEATRTLTQLQNAPKKDNAKLKEAEKTVAKSYDELTEPLNNSFKQRSTNDYPDQTTGRRTAFAKWLTSSANPLTARVAANHLWLRHFGAGIVPTPADFGRNGRPPSHPQLLDYLATELVANKWQMKPMHRLIVTSATYCMASTLDESDAKIDPDNTYLWRAPSRRMEAELVRDNILYATNQLDSTMGGPEIDNALGLVSRRRSIYLRIAPEKEVEFLKLFDSANPNECYERRPSVMPQQALAMSNSELIINHSRTLAGELSKQAGADDQRFINLAFLQILSRPPTAEEMSICSRALAAHPTTRPSDSNRPRQNLVLVLFNHNDFVTIR